MKPFTRRSYLFTFISIIGLGFSIYAGMIGNKIMLGAAVLFTLVSIDNIFCDLVEKKKQ